MANNTTKIIVIILVLALILYIISISKKLPSPRVSRNGCTNPEAFNYNPEAQVDDGTCQMLKTACCNDLAENYDATCSGDPECQCQQSTCILTTGRTACCETGDTNYDGSCLTDAFCTCDSSACASSNSGVSRSACCVVGSDNYDSTCFSDPYCSCDNELCELPTTYTSCYSVCNISNNFQTLLSSVPCGTGAATNYPNINPPNCGGSGG